MKSIDDILNYIRTNSKKGDWQLCYDGEWIRRNSQCHIALFNECPICWIGSQLGKNPTSSCSDFRSISRALGLDLIRVTIPIVRAADNTITEGDNLRVKLLEACRLA